MSIDVFYTPSTLPAKLVSLSTLAAPKLIADFCAGDGQLLRAAAQRWPDARLLGTDLKTKALKKWAEDGEITTGQCDFMKSKSRNSCIALRKLEESVDLILLNPPFSHRGGAARLSHVGDEQVRASPALSIVLAAIPYLRKGGQILAVLPAGCLRSQKNERAWHLLRLNFSFSVLATNDHRVFDGCVPRTVLIRLQRRNICKPADKITCQLMPLANVAIVRGRLPMHKFKSSRARSSVPFLHTTQLRKKSIDLSGERTVRSSRTIVGIFVILPRVGKPSREKIAVLETDGVTLSDCLFALECQSVGLAEVIASALDRDWSNFCRLYRGTGAPYTTVRDLQNYLAPRLGAWLNEDESASSHSHLELASAACIKSSVPEAAQL